MGDDLQIKIDTLVMFYECNGYEDFYEDQIKCRTKEQIYELYYETFGDEGFGV